MKLQSTKVTIPAAVYPHWHCLKPNNLWLNILHQSENDPLLCGACNYALSFAQAYEEKKPNTLEDMAKIWDDIDDQDISLIAISEAKYILRDFWKYYPSLQQQGLIPF